MADDKDFIGTPWWINDMPEDYTRTRSGLQYDSVDDLIGKKDYRKYTLTTDDVATVSGTEGTILR